MARRGFWSWLFVCLLSTGLVLFVFSLMSPLVIRSPGFERRLRVGEIRSLNLDAVRMQRIDAVIQDHSRWVMGKLRGQDLEKPILRFQKDIDGDGKPDDIYSIGASLDIETTSGKVVYRPSPGVFPSGVTSVGFDDVDGDGILDAWCCDPDDTVLEVLWGNSEGRFTREEQLFIGYAQVKGAFFDVDSDGDLDIVLKTGEYTEIRSATPTVITGTGEFLWIELDKR